MMYRRVSTQDVDALRASRTERDRMYDRAARRAEPHWAHEGDIERVADEVLNRWLRRAVRTGDEILFLQRLYALPDRRLMGGGGSNVAEVAFCALRHP